MKILEEVEDHPQVSNNVALCYKQLGQWDKVVEYTDKTLAIKPDYIKSLVYRG